MKNFIKKIFNWTNDKLGSFRKDLLIHAGVSLAMFVLIFNLLILCMPASFAALWATFITLVIGVFKEYVIDKIFRDSYADIQDLYADVAGTIIGIIVTLPLWF